jgi:hypothetical protein
MEDKKIVKQLLTDSILGVTFTVYAYAALAIGWFIEAFIGYFIYDQFWPQFIFISATTGLFAFNGTLLISTRVETLSDALFAGFGECPARLMTGAREVYNLLDKDTQEEMLAKIKEGDKEKPAGFFSRILVVFGAAAACCCFKSSDEEGRRRPEGRLSIPGEEPLFPHFTKRIL